MYFAVVYHAESTQAELPILQPRFEGRTYLFSTIIKANMLWFSPRGNHLFELSDRTLFWQIVSTRLT